jgi:hypothetical protein
MQNLKSYRENNPGKGYWDWKVEAFAEGGQTGDPEKERFYQATGRSSKRAIFAQNFSRIAKRKKKKK